jgi:hypothetical protein
MPHLTLHWIKRWIQRNYIKFYRKFVDLDGIDKQKYDYEIEAIQICKKLIMTNESILLMAPISGKRFVKNEKMGIYVILEGRGVKVINHIYSYNVILGDKAWNKLLSFYDDEIESRRIEFEKEITSNIKHSLKNILIEIDEKI